uniref:RNA polymerase sigma factor n=1 Tax=Rheinheimera sp. BAL341 TaxID=1708203 RepID=A0A486XPS7_9GAMM
MASIHFLPARPNQARLSVNAVSTKPTAMKQPDTPQTPPTAAVFQLNDSKTRRYEQLVKHYHADVYRYGYWLCKDADIAQDLVQETFLRAWKSLDSLLDANAAKAWLITILRRENARRFERKQFAFDDDTEQDSLPDNEQTSAEQSIDNAKLREHLAALPEEYREPLVLQALGGFSSDEIANLLQLNVNTVNTRLFRARKLLRNSLELLGEPSHG